MDLPESIGVMRFFFLALIGIGFIVLLIVLSAKKVKIIQPDEHTPDVNELQAEPELESKPKSILYNAFFKDLRIIYFLIIPVLFILLFVNMVLKDPVSGQSDILANAMISRDYKTAEAFFESRLEKNKTNLAFHRDFINTHFKVPKRLGKNTNRDDAHIYNLYESFSKSKDPALSDIGYYGLGFYCVSMNQLDKALSFYFQVKNTNLVYLNNSIGYIYLSKKDYDTANRYFSNEVRVKGNISSAYDNMAKAYYNKKDFAALHALVNNPESKESISPFLIRISALYDNDVGLYLILYFKTLLSHIGLEGVVASFFILLLWLVYLRNLDLFEPEKFAPMMTTLVLGMVISVLCLLLYDFWDYRLGFRITGFWQDDLLYSIFGIGFIEELVKFIPFIIILSFTKEVNESIDYVIYASVSALGFAFIENLHYLSSSGINSLYDRSLSAVILHMSLSSLVVYGFIYSRYYLKGKNLIPIFLSFLAAISIHGVYDFFLISPSVSDFSIISILLLFFTLNWYKTIITNSINTSVFFNKKIVDRFTNLFIILVYGLTYIYLLQYVMIALLYGPVVANTSLTNSSISFLIFLFLVSSTLGQVRIKKGIWRGLLFTGVKRV